MQEHEDVSPMVKQMQVLEKRIDELQKDVVFNHTQSWEGFDQVSDEILRLSNKLKFVKGIEKIPFKCVCCDGLGKRTIFDKSKILEPIDLVCIACDASGVLWG